MVSTFRIRAASFFRSSYRRSAAPIRLRYIRMELVSCPISNMAFAVGQLAVFHGASEAPISGSYGRANNPEKQPTGHGPEGCDENGPAAALLVGYVSMQICALLAPCRRPILIATKAMLFMGQDTSLELRAKLQPSR